MPAQSPFCNNCWRLTGRLDWTLKPRSVGLNVLFSLSEKCSFQPSMHITKYSHTGLFKGHFPLMWYCHWRAGATCVEEEVVGAGRQCRVVQKSPLYGVVLDFDVKLKCHGTDEWSNSSVALLNHHYHHYPHKYCQCKLVSCPKKSNLVLPSVHLSEMIKAEGS